MLADHMSPLSKKIQKIVWFSLAWQIIFWPRFTSSWASSVSCCAIKEPSAPDFLCSSSLCRTHGFKNATNCDGKAMPRIFARVKKSSPICGFSPCPYFCLCPSVRELQSESYPSRSSVPPRCFNASSRVLSALSVSFGAIILASFTFGIAGSTSKNAATS